MSDTKEIKLSLTGQAYERFAAMLQKTEGTPEDVIKNALRLYEAMIAEAEQGNIFLLKQPNGDIVPYEVF